MVDQIVHHQRRATSVRTLITDAVKPTPHFDPHLLSANDITGGPIFPRSGLIGRYNLALGHLADRGHFIECLQMAAQMKTRDVKPDILTYHSLIRAAGARGLANQAVAIFEDMLAFGLQPERETFHLLFKVSFLAQIGPGCPLIIEQAQLYQRSSVILLWWRKMLEAEILPDATSYEILIKHLTREENLEMALTILTEMEKRDLSPSTETAESVVLLAAKQANPRLALDLATSYEVVSVRPLSTAVWVHVLASCAEHLFVSQDDGIPWGRN